MTDTNTTRPRSRGTEHHIASRRWTFSPSPQKGFVLSPTPIPTPPLEHLLFCFVITGGRTPWHIRSHIRLGAILSSPLPPLQTQCCGQGVKYARSHQYVAQSGANVQFNKWMMVRDPRRRPASTVATPGTLCIVSMSKTRNWNIAVGEEER